VVIGANRRFAEQAPTIIAFLKRYETDAALVSDALAYMEETAGTAEDAANNFLNTRFDLWSSWVDESTASRIRESLP
jgi:glycine betaine/proline transport system substrate-binding protein